MEIDEIIATEVICERRETESGKIKLDKYKKWVEWMKKQPGFLGYVIWAHGMCTGDEVSIMLIAYVSNSEKPDGFDHWSDQKKDDYLIDRYRLYLLPDDFYPKIVFADEFPEYTESEVSMLTWCGCCFEEHRAQEL